MKTAARRRRKSHATAAARKARPAKKAVVQRRRPAKAPATRKRAAIKKSVAPSRTRRAAPRAKAAAPPSAAAKQPTKAIAARPRPSAPKWTDTLSDGTHVIVRPITAKDAQLERQFIERLSPESRRLRFLGQIGEPSDEMVRRFVTIDYDRDMAFVALVHRDNETREIGVSRYGRGADGKSCECAVTVSDEWRHRGLATLLMRHLIDFARAHGVRSMVSYDAIENTEMRTLAEGLGFERRTDPEDPRMVIHRLAL